MGYDPNQPRDPAGEPTGGQWTAEGLDRVEAAAREAAGLPKLSKFKKERTLKAIARKVTDNVPIEQRFSPPGSKEYEYSYWSPSRPVSKMWLKTDEDFILNDEASMLFTKEPLSIDEIVKYELSPQYSNSKSDLIKKYYSAQYPGSKAMVLMSRDPSSMMGVVIAKSARKKGQWQVSRFDEWGFSGHSNYASFDAAVYDSAQQYLRPVAPSFLDRISKKWKTLESRSS